MSLSPRDYDEKRGFIRMDVNCKVIYKSPSDNTLFEGVTKNLSGTGILFEAEQELQLNQLLEVHVKPEREVTPPLEAIGRVIRVNGGDNGKFDICIEFQEMRNAL